jgi:predicted small secreted protein
MFNTANYESKKSFIVYIVLGLAVIIFLGFYFLQNRVSSYEFSGRVTKVENNLVYATGVFIYNNPEIDKEERDVVIEVREETILKRDLLNLPSNEELERTGGIFNPQDLERENSTVTFQEFIEDFNTPGNVFIGGVTIKAKSEKNIHNKNRFSVSELEYIVAIQSK